MPLTVRRVLFSMVCGLGCGQGMLAATAAEPARSPAPAWRPSQRTALDEIERIRPRILSINRDIWDFAEVGLEETKSAALLTDELRKEGFEVRSGLAGMPTAFVASYGEGKPVIAVLAEYDALPEMSQQALAVRNPARDGAAGHACGHSGLGAGAWGAAVAVKKAMQAGKIPGTLRLYGTPAEEAVIGKVYLLLDKHFEDVDLCLHWHPGTRNEVWNGTSKAVVSAKFAFHGVAAHASGNPAAGRSALDGVELMNVGANFMREHIKPDARIHYVITAGGGQPNVVPAKAEVWYYVRSDDHRDVEENFAWLQEIAAGAAKMSRTRLEMRIETDCHELIPNTPLSQVIQNNFDRLPPPQFTAEEVDFARRLRATFPDNIRAPAEPLLHDSVARLPAVPVPSQGSTDVGDISWHLPTGGFRTTCFVAESPGHSWQNTACIGSSIGEKGIVYAAQVLACSTLDLFEDGTARQAAVDDWKKRMNNRKYTSLIPPGQKTPQQLR